MSDVALHIRKVVIEAGPDAATARRLAALLEDALRLVGERLARDRLSAVTSQHEIALDRIALSPLSLAELGETRLIEALADELYTQIERTRA